MKKNKTKLIIVISSVIFIFVLFILLISNQSERQTSYFYDKELGIIKYEIYKQKFLDLIQQTVTFVPDTVEINQQATMQERYEVPNIGSECIYQYEIVLYKPDDSVADFLTETCILDPFTTGETISQDISFTPNVIGTWRAITTYWHSASGCTACSAVGAQNTINSANQLTVTAATTVECGADEYTNWITSENITGGRIEERVHYTFGTPPNCEEDFVSEFRTICDGAYHLTGNANDNEGPAPGQLTCEIDVVENTTCNSSNCASPNICNPTTNQCVTPECNTDLLCSGTTIIDKRCIDHVWVDQNVECPAQNTTAGNTTAGNTTANQKTCFKFNTNSTACENHVITGTSCPFGEYSTIQLCDTALEEENKSNNKVLIYSIIIIAIFLIALAVILIRRFRK